LKKFIHIASIVVIAAVAAVLIVFLQMRANASDWGTLLGSTLGGAVGSLALMYAAMYTIGEQRADDERKERQKKEWLLTAIWAELRVVFELQCAFINAVVNYLEEPAEETAAVARRLGPYEEVSLRLLDQKLQKIGQFGLDVQNCLINLDFEAKMQLAAWRSFCAPNASTMMPEIRPDLENVRDWSVRTLARLVIARCVLAQALGRDDFVCVGAPLARLIDEENLAVIRLVLGEAAVQSLSEGIRIKPVISERETSLEFRGVLANMGI
jgi:hypothetical protein